MWREGREQEKNKKEKREREGGGNGTYPTPRFSFSLLMSLCAVLAEALGTRLPRDCPGRVEAWSE